MRRNDIIDQIMIDSDLVMILDYSYAESTTRDVDTIIQDFVCNVIKEVEPIIQDQDKIDKIKNHLGLAKHSSC
jgi:hypothetical protein